MILKFTELRRRAITQRVGPDLKVDVLGSFAFILPARLSLTERGKGIGSKSLEETEGEKNRGKVIVVK